MAKKKTIEEVNDTVDEVMTVTENVVETPIVAEEVAETEAVETVVEEPKTEETVKVEEPEVVKVSGFKVVEEVKTENKPVTPKKSFRNFGYYWNGQCFD